MYSVCCVCMFFPSIGQVMADHPYDKQISGLSGRNLIASHINRAEMHSGVRAETASAISNCSSPIESYGADSLSSRRVRDRVLWSNVAVRLHAPGMRKSISSFFSSSKVSGVLVSN